MSPRTILIFGATGQQGTAVIKALEDLNAKSSSAKYKIQAVTRDMAGDKAKRLLAHPNVQLVEGDLGKPETLPPLFAQPVHGLFLVQANTGTVQPERDEGIALLSLAAKHHVGHIVYSTAERAGQADTGIPSFEAKRAIEAHLATLPVKWTVIRPTAFMDNFYWAPYRELVTYMFSDKIKHKMIAVADIGRMAATIFNEPENAKFANKAIDIAGDALTKDQIIAVWKEGTGETLQHKREPQVPPALLEVMKFLQEHEYVADVKENRALFPFVLDLKSWLAQTPFATAPA